MPSFPYSKIDEQQNIIWSEDIEGSKIGKGDRNLQEVSDGGFVYASGDFWHIWIVKTDENGVVNDIDDNTIPVAADELYNYPNPFNPTTTICFSTAESTEDIEIVIYNIKGERVKRLRIKDEGLRMNKITWNGKDDHGKPVGSGVYFYNLSINGKTKAVEKCLLLK